MSRWANLEHLTGIAIYIEDGMRSGAEIHREDHGDIRCRGKSFPHVDCSPEFYERLKAALPAGGVGDE